MKLKTKTEIYLYHAFWCETTCETIDKVHFHLFENFDAWWRVWTEQYLASLKEGMDVDERINWPLKLSAMKHRIAQTHFCPVC